MSEIISDVLCQLMLVLCGIRKSNNKFHYEAETNSKTVNFSMIKDNSIILSNDCSYLSFLYLQSQFSPIYLVPTFDQKSFHELKNIELITHPLGIKFYSKGQSLKEIISTQKIKKPIVLFIEGTKTNGKGVLKISEQLCGQLMGYSLHTVRIDFNFAHFSPFNTTSSCGLVFLISSLREISHYLFAYYTLGIDSRIKEQPKNMIKIISMALTTKRSQYLLEIDASKHKEYLQMISKYKSN